MVWAGDLAGAREFLAAIDDATLRGAPIELDRNTLDAGILGLERRFAEALLGFRESIAGFTSLGLAFDAALAMIDLVSAVPEAERSSPDVAVMIETAQGTLERLGARPFLDRMEQALVGGPGAEPRRSSARATAPVASEIG